MPQGALRGRSLTPRHRTWRFSRHASPRHQTECICMTTRQKRVVWVYPRLIESGGTSKKLNENLKKRIFVREQVFCYSCFSSGRTSVREDLDNRMFVIR
jgi:hypothetical protein